MNKADKNTLYLSYLKLLYELSVQENDGVDVNLIVKGFLQRKSNEMGVSQKEIAEKIGTATTVARRKIISALFMIEDEIETTAFQAGVVAGANNQYRYSLKNIQEFYQRFAKRNITRQALNQQKNRLLPVQEIPNEYTSVLEDDLINYFYTQTGIKLDPNEIRPHAYKKPLQR